MNGFALEILMMLHVPVVIAGEKLRLLEEQLVDLVNVPNPSSNDMNLDGLIRWAPESVVAKVCHCFRVRVFELELMHW